MKKIILAATVIIASKSSFSQTLLNSNFEENMYEYNSSQFPGNYFTLGWDGFENSPDNQVVHGGNQSVKLETKTDMAVHTAYPTIFPNSIIAGNIHQEIIGSVTHPENVELSVWYKYTSIGSDSAYIDVSILDTLNTGYQDDKLIFYGSVLIPPTATNWTNTVISMTPIQPGNANSIFIYAQSSTEFSQNIGSTLWIDDFTLTNNSNSSNASLTENSNSFIQIFPNPIENYFKINSEEILSSITLISSDGKKISIPLTNNEGNLDGLSSGIYHLEFMLNGKLIFKKIIKK